MVLQKNLRNFFLAFSVLLILSGFLSIEIVVAQPDSLILEVERHWDTYGIGGTCISGTHNVAVADVDDDTSPEIITGGFAYSYANGTRVSLGAPLRIWSWNGKNLTLEKGENWLGSIGCVSAGDADGDGKVEILTAGRLRNDSNSVYALRLWNWNGQDLILRGSYSGISVRSIFVCDVDEDNTPEILTVGRAYNASQPNAQLNIWRWDGSILSNVTSAEWSATNDIARANSVYAADLDKDGIVEIVTGGYVYSPTNSSGQLRIWQFDGTKLSLKANAEWRMVEGYSLDSAGNVMGNTMVYTIKVADVDDDGFSEVVSGGFTYDGTRVEAQLRIWNWTNGVLDLEESREWITSDITELKSISVDDVDSDGKKEIVTSGVHCGYGSFAENAPDKSRAELRVWSWDGRSLTLKLSTDWIVGEGVCAWNEGTGDVDSDGVVEIVTVGCMYVGRLCDPDLRIWSLTVQSASSLFPYDFIAIAVIVAAIVALAVYLFIKKQR
jgi:hypothetical protein